MKRIILFLLLIILFSCQFTFADDASPYKKKRQKEVLSLSYTMFFNNHRYDEMSIYLSTIHKSDINVIQRIDGIQVVINKDGTMVGKVFSFNQNPTDIVMDVLCKLFGTAA